MTNELLAIYMGVEVGRVLRRGANLSFFYSEEWRRRPDSFPLSLSMPLALPEHSHTRIEPFLWGLLPDNAEILDKWARRYQVSPRSAFALISHVGEDCAGAIQFVNPQRLPKLQAEPAQSEIVWLSENDIADRLKQLRQDHSAWRTVRDTGQFSLAGAQPKTAFLLRDGRWGVPSGRTPTTHILKPPLGEWEGHAENEHFCLELAATLGMVVAKTTVQRFKDEVAIVVERFDRYVSSAGLLRRHQEDMCQALALPPTRKYQSDGGPSARQVTDLLTYASNAPLEDVQRFVEALAFNWFIGGADAHAKNYSILIGAETSVRLAPLYDVASILPYPGIQVPKLKMAMKIGGQYRLRMIGPSQWRKLARELRINEDRLIQRLREMAAALPDQAATVRDQILKKELKHPIIERLGTVISKRAKACAEYLEL